MPTCTKDEIEPQHIHRQGEGGALLPYYYYNGMWYLTRYHFKHFISPRTGCINLALQVFILFRSLNHQNRETKKSLESGVKITGNHFSLEWTITDSISWPGTVSRISQHTLEQHCCDYSSTHLWSIQACFAMF